jgi:hypothetical protein
LADPAAGEGEAEGAEEAAAPIAWEEICRPWQPGPDRDVCAMTAAGAPVLVDRGR